MDSYSWTSKSRISSSPTNVQTDQLEEIFEKVAYPVIALNRQWKIMFANAVFLGHTGYVSEDIKGKDWVDVFIPEDKKEKTKNTQELITEGHVEASESIKYEILKKNGEKLCVCWRNNVVKSPEGQFIGMICTGESVSAASMSLQEMHNSKILHNYELAKNLSGDRAHVHLAVDKRTGEKVALKLLAKKDMKPEDIERARREIQIMKKLTPLNNPYIIKMIDAEETESNFNLVMEYVSGGELVAHILSKKGYPEPFAKLLFKQLLIAVKCCHENNIIHRDVKLQNILLDSQNNVRLIDFGLSNFLESGVFRNTFCGTPAYAPPEILLGNQYEGPEVDVWSLGVCLYSIITAEFPFRSIAEILKGKFEESPLSLECVALLKRMLEVDKQKRATLGEVMQHPWLHENVSSDSPRDTQNEPSPKRQRVSE